MSDTKGLTEGENMLEIPEGFIQLTINTSKERVLVRLASIEMVRDTFGDAYVQTTGGGIYVNETVEQVAQALRTASIPNEEGN